MSAQLASQGVIDIARDIAARGFEYQGIYFLDDHDEVMLMRRSETEEFLESLLVSFDVALALPADALAPPKRNRQAADVKAQIHWYQATNGRQYEHETS